MLMVIIQILLNAGCAVQYFDITTQTEHLWGFGHLRMKAVPANEGVQAVVKGTEILGASVKLGAEDYQLMFGWDRTSQMKLVSEGTSLRLEWPDSDMFKVRVGTSPPFLSNKTSIDSNISDDQKMENVK